MVSCDGDLNTNNCINNENFNKILVLIVLIMAVDMYDNIYVIDDTDPILILLPIPFIY